MIYFLGYIAILVSVPQFHKKNNQSSIKKDQVAFGDQFAQSFANLQPLTKQIYTHDLLPYIH